MTANSNQKAEFFACPEAPEAPEASAGRPT